MGRDAAPGMLNEMGSRVGKNFFKDTKQSYQGYEVFLKADKMKCIDIIDIISCVDRTRCCPRHATY